MSNKNILPIPSLTRAICPIEDDFVQIGRVDGVGQTCTRILCKKITEKEHERLKDGENITITINDVIHYVNASNCYAFGEIDFENEDDISLIRSFKWMNDLKPSSFVPRHYNYNSHMGDIVNGRYAFVETYDNFLALKYAHARLGKPKLIALLSIITRLPYTKDRKTD